MPRLARLLAVTVAAASLVGATAVTALACPGAKADAASTGSCSSKSTVQMTSSGGQCASKTASSCPSSCAWSKQASAANADCGKVCAEAISAMASMEPFKFLNDVDGQKVNLSVETTEQGFAFVFAAVGDADVAMAKHAAAQSMEMISTPAHCSMTRGAMAEKSGGCKYTEACLSALADAEVQTVDTPTGAKTLVTAKDEAHAKELHAFLASLVPAPQGTSKS